MYCFMRHQIFKTFNYSADRKNICTIQNFIKFKALFSGHHLANSLIPRYIFVIDKRYFNVDAAKEEALKFQLNVDKNYYFKICDLLKNDRSEQVPLEDLPYLPRATIEHNEPLYFVDNVLPNYWPAVEKNLHKFTAKQLSIMLYYMQKVDYFSNSSGGVSNVIKWQSIEKIVEQFCRKFVHYSSDLMRLLSTLCQFNQSNPTFKLSAPLKFNVSKTLSFVCLHESRNEVLSHLGHILYYMSFLEIALSNNQMNLVVPLCDELWKIGIEYDEMHLINCQRLGAAVYRYSRTPDGQLLQNYFRPLMNNYFQSVMNNYCYKEEKTRFCVTTLKMFALIGIFFCETDFKRYHRFWCPAMSRLVHRLRKPEIDEILDLSSTKFDGNLHIIRDVLSSEIFRQLVANSSSFEVDVDENKLKSTVSYSNIDFTKSLKMNKDKYLNFCEQLATDNVPIEIPAYELSRLPEGALDYKDETNFVNCVLSKWLTHFERSFREILGGRLVHTLYALMLINEKKGTKDSVWPTVMRNNPNIVDQMVAHIFKDVSNPDFSHSTMWMTLRCLISLQRYNRISDELRSLTSTALCSFFEPDIFHKKKFKETAFQSVGTLILYSTRLSLERPSNDCLKTIVDCCANSFKNSTLVIVKDYLRTLDCFIVGFSHWHFDPDDFVKNFTVQLLQLINDNMLKLGDSDFEYQLRNALLFRSLLFVLEFDKEKEFSATFQQRWQLEMKQNLARKRYFKHFNAMKIFETAKKCRKRDNLEKLVSLPVLNNMLLYL